MILTLIITNFTIIFWVSIIINTTHNTFITLNIFMFFITFINTKLFLNICIIITILNTLYWSTLNLILITYLLTTLNSNVNFLFIYFSFIEILNIINYCTNNRIININNIIIFCLITIVISFFKTSFIFTNIFCIIILKMTTFECILTYITIRI